MNKLIVSIAINIALGFLKKLSKELWDAVWDLVFDAVVSAETKWSELGKGEIKKTWFINTVIDFINSKKKMGAMQEWAMRRFLSIVADAIIKELNYQLGKDWLMRVTRVKALLGSKIPFVKVGKS